MTAAERGPEKGRKQTRVGVKLGPIKGRWLHCGVFPQKYSTCFSGICYY
jgi:hypothetical protein